MKIPRWLALTLAACIGLGAYVAWQTLRDAEPPAGLLAGETGNVDLFSPADSRIRVLYFGYTRCPDVCPTSLAMLAAALRQLPSPQLQRLWPVFISLDPERDSATLSAEYAHYFHPALTGLHATPGQLKRLAERYGVIYMKTELKDSELGYTVDHSSYFYFLQPDGTLIEKVPHTLDPGLIVAAAQRLLVNQGDSK